MNQLRSRHVPPLLAIACSILTAGLIAFAPQRADSPGALAAPPLPLHGIGCASSQRVTYHVHAHLTVLVHGSSQPIPQFIGFDYSRDCLFWLHTHDLSGVVHVEAPYRIVPTLGDFFAVWERTRDDTRPPGDTLLQRIKSARSRGLAVRIYVDLKPYHRSLESIPLRRHTVITVEIGGPFRLPRPYDFGIL